MFDQKSTTVNLLTTIDEVMDNTKFEVSPDGKTLTLTVRQTGQTKAQTVVYNKM